MDPIAKARLMVADQIWRVARRRYFNLKPEPAHKLLLRDLDRLHGPNLLDLFKIFRSPLTKMPTTIFGKPWANPVCIPAGFAKQFEIPLMLAIQTLGFGAVSAGTVVPQKQFGNIGERLWRMEEHGALQNWLGFNSDGVIPCRDRFEKLIKQYPKFIPVGVSGGKNALTPDELEPVVKDYYAIARYFIAIMRSWYDWLEINISSPNTKGLRGIFEWLDEFLDAYTSAVRAFAQFHGFRPRAIVLKLSPDDLTNERAEYIVTTAAKYGVAGFMLTNTTVDEALKRELGMVKQDGSLLPGGISGRPLYPAALRAVQMIGPLAHAHGLDLVVGGGLGTREQVTEVRRVGGPAVKGSFVLTSFIYRGPSVIHEHLLAWSEKP